MHAPDLPKSTNPHLGKEVTGNETFQLDSFLDQKNQFLLETGELIKHYDEQVAREREKFIKELEEKYKNTKLNKTVKPSAHSPFEIRFRIHEKSESENIIKRIVQLIF